MIYDLELPKVNVDRVLVCEDPQNIVVRVTHAFANLRNTDQLQG